MNILAKKCFRVLTLEFSKHGHVSMDCLTKEGSDDSKALQSTVFNPQSLNYIRCLQYLSSKNTCEVYGINLWKNFYVDSSQIRGLCGNSDRSNTTFPFSLFLGLYVKTTITGRVCDLKKTIFTCFYCTVFTRNTRVFSVVLLVQWVKGLLFTLLNLNLYTFWSVSDHRLLFSLLVDLLEKNNSF